MGASTGDTRTVSRDVAREREKDGVTAQGRRFALPGVKHRGITSGKNASGGHRSEAMRQLFDLSVPVVQTSNAAGEKRT